VRYAGLFEARLGRDDSAGADGANGGDDAGLDDLGGGGYAALGGAQAVFFDDLDRAALDLAILGGEGGGIGDWAPERLDIAAEAADDADLDGLARFDPHLLESGLTIGDVAAVVVIVVAGACDGEQRDDCDECEEPGPTGLVAILKHAFPS
jgi:hypothetical protein